MNASATAVHAGTSAALCALVRCGDLVVAIPARLVIRLALVDEVAVLDAGGYQPWVRAFGLEAPAWSLGALLGLDAAAASWLLLAADTASPPDRDGARPTVVALSAGTCLAVRVLPAPVPLPPGLFRHRADAVVGTFRLDDRLRGAGASIAGLWIDPIRLIGPTALAAAVAARVAPP